MNKKNLIIFIPLIFLLLVLGIIWARQTKFFPTTTFSPPTAKPTPFRGEGEFKILTGQESEGVIPVTIQFKTGPTPQNQGIIGLKAVLTYPQDLVTLTQDNILTTLPPPWQYVHKEIANGQVSIEAIFLARGEGDPAKPGAFRDLATLNFTRINNGVFNFSLLNDKSGIFSKKGNFNLLRK